MIKDNSITNYYCKKSKFLNNKGYSVKIWWFIKYLGYDHSNKSKFSNWFFGKLKYYLNYSLQQIIESKLWNHTTLFILV